PYAEITLWWLNKQGINYHNNDFKSFYIKGNQKYKPSIPICLENLIEITQLGRFPNSIYFFFSEFLEKWKEIQEENA
ncbi:MAG: hypothetical protein N3A69_10205, partial [Leptospiraceae bacterium]|nr:hypothetical protein [Leptospiraceae bacterium]